MAFGGDYLAGPAAFQMCLMRFLVRAGCEGILHLTGNAVLTAQQFCCHAHVTRRFGGIFCQTRVEVQVKGHWHMTHVLHTTNHVHVALTGHNAFSGIMQRLHG